MCAIDASSSTRSTTSRRHRHSIGNLMHTIIMLRVRHHRSIAIHLNNIHRRRAIQHRCCRQLMNQHYRQRHHRGAPFDRFVNRRMMSPNHYSSFSLFVYLLSSFFLSFSILSISQRLESVFRSSSSAFSSSANNRHHCRIMSLTHFQRFLLIEREAIPFIDIFKALYNARDFQHNTAPGQPMLQLMVAYLISSLGGTTITSLILGQPVGFLQNDRVVCSYLFVFFLAFNPYTRRVFKLLVNAPVLRTIISAMDDISWGNCVSTLGVQKALNPNHSESAIRLSISAAVLCGITSGCGGGLIRSMFNFNNSTWSFSTPRHFSAPHWPIVWSTILSVTYYLITNPHGYIGIGWKGIDINQAKWTLICMCLCMNTIWNSIGVSEWINVSKDEVKAIKSVAIPTAATLVTSPAPSPSSSTTRRRVAASVVDAELSSDASASPAPSSSKKTRSGKKSTD